MERLALSLPDEVATDALGRALGAELGRGDLVLLVGDLGAGKTALARAIARGAGVPEAVPVTSPTFGLVHELPGRVPILHVDVYRLTDPEELVELGLLDRDARQALTLVEWGDRFPGALGAPTLTASLAVTGPSSRELLLVAAGAVGDRVLRALRVRGAGAPWAVAPPRPLP